LDLLARLVESARTGEPRAFAALAEELRPNIFQLTSRFARTPHDFDDLSQEICLRLWKSLPSLRDSTLFLGWFKPLAVRACYDWLRRRRTRQDREVSREALAALGELPADVAPSNEAAERATEIIHAAMATLKPDERLIISLLELEEHSVAETAALTGWSEGNVKVRAHRARAALKRVLLAQRDEMTDPSN
jgi:RNA polymerase sigma-70 factor (ECF subfamily)